MDRAPGPGARFAARLVCPPMTVLARGDYSLHYVVSGRRHGPAVVLVHALGTSLDVWAPQMAALDRRFRVIRVDLRGHGRSSASAGAPQPCAMTDLADDVIAVLDAIGVARPHWCGLSIGGMIAMWAAVAAPQRVAKLVLAATAAHFPPPEAWQDRIDAALRDGLSGLADGVAERWFTAEFRQREPQVVQRTVEAFAQTSVRGYAECCAAVRDMDQRDRIAAIHAPTLVIAGASDPATTMQHAQYLVEQIPGADMRVLDAAHLCNVEQPVEFGDALVEFLGD